MSDQQPPSPAPVTPPDPPAPSVEPLRRGTLIVTNVIKLAGLVVAINELVLRSQLRPLSAGIAVFMMAGAQVSESVLLAAIDRFLGRSTSR
jgi:hypothetical protein